MRGRTPPRGPAGRSPAARRGSAARPPAAAGAKVVLEEGPDHPLCPWCEARLERIRWHRIRGGPPLAPYTIVLTCPACRSVLEALTGGGDGAGFV